MRRALLVALVLGAGFPGAATAADTRFTVLASGDILKVVATDPGSVRDFQAFARQTGNELVEQTSANDEFVHFLRRR